jgi:hypothetical protein
VRQFIGILKELWGLFVDDRSYALAILVWIGIAALGARHIAESRWAGPALFAGLGLILVESVIRSKRGIQKKRNG